MKATSIDLIILGILATLIISFGVLIGIAMIIAAPIFGKLIGIAFTATMIFAIVGLWKVLLN